MKGGLPNCVLVCGSRTWNNYYRIYDRLRQLPKDTVIIEGEHPGAYGKRGAELLARKAALRLGFDVIGVPANWVKNRKAGIMVRNLNMLRFCPYLVIAFDPDVGSSLWTRDVVEQARQKGIMVEVIPQ